MRWCLNYGFHLKLSTPRNNLLLYVIRRNNSYAPNNAVIITVMHIARKSGKCMLWVRYDPLLKKVTHDDNVAIRLPFGNLLVPTWSVVKWSKHPVTTAPYTILLQTLITNICNISTVQVYCTVYRTHLFHLLCSKAGQLNICSTVLVDRDQKAIIICVIACCMNSRIYVYGDTLATWKDCSAVWSTSIVRAWTLPKVRWYSYIR
jgi:hypothetical protein